MDISQSKSCHLYGNAWKKDEAMLIPKRNLEITKKSRNFHSKRCEKQNDAIFAHGETTLLKEPHPRNCSMEKHTDAKSTRDIETTKLSRNRWSCFGFRRKTAVSSCRISKNKEADPEVSGQCPRSIAHLISTPIALSLYLVQAVDLFFFFFLSFFSQIHK